MTGLNSNHFRRRAFHAGLLYLLIIVCGMSAELAVRGPLISADYAQTAANLLQQQMRFRSGFMLDLLMICADVMLALLLYRLLQPAGRTLSCMAALLRLLQAVLLAVNLMLYFTALLVLQNTALNGVFQPSQTQALAAFLLQLHAVGYDFGLIFFALSNICLAPLIMRMENMPDWLGYALLAAAAVYLSGSLLRFTVPWLAEQMQLAYLIPLLSESAFCLWLLSQQCRRERPALVE